MKTYIWAYEATTCHGVGIMRGRIEASNGFNAMEAVKASNLMIESVKVAYCKIKTRRAVKNMNL